MIGSEVCSALEKSALRAEPNALAALAEPHSWIKSFGWSVAVAAVADRGPLT